PAIMAATRISNGAVVQLKKISLPKHDDEYSIATYFSSELLASEPQNHCIPVVEVIKIPKDESIVVLVFPNFQSLRDAKFETRDDSMEFLGQIFEGIQFLHKNNVAHRNCTLSNIKVVHPPKAPKMSKLRKTGASTDGHLPPKYYLDNFEHSRRYDTGNELVTDLPVYGADKTVPEFQGDKYHEPSDPFAVDIYYIGHMIETEFIDRKRNVDFMLPLVTDMVQENPAARPTIGEVVERFDHMRLNLKS
ncbi:hypothetical protein BU17DRAFT_9249, partial [Hysterangium stoloniferum]